VIPAINIEYFHDHTRIEQRFFDGAIIAKSGWVEPNLSSYGIGLEFKYQDAEVFRVC
jgi:hypothetical protein